MNHHRRHALPSLSAVELVVAVEKVAFEDMTANRAFKRIFFHSIFFNGLKPGQPIDLPQTPPW
jgi:hypothetical protein